MKLKRFRAFVLCLLCPTGIMAAGSAVVGVALKTGPFLVDGMKVTGTATLMSGNRIETGAGPALLMLTNGTRVILGESTSGSVFADRVVIEHGSGEVKATASGFAIDAANLRIASDSYAATRLHVRPSGAVHVDAMTGVVQVHSSQGALLARLEPSTSLDFTPPPDKAIPATKVTGIIRKSGDRYILEDETSRVTFELLGENLASLVGQRVELEGMQLDGAPKSHDAKEVIRVVKTTKLEKASAISHARHVPTAVIAGVGVAAAAASAGIVASGQGEVKSVSPSSR